MATNHLRLIYMGTPDFAVAPLKSLLRAGCNVVAVITAPDKPAGRGKKIRFSAVKEFVLQLNQPLALLQPANLKDPEFVKLLKDLKPDLQVVVAFRMLPEVIWRTPPLGTFNLHASLLPQYRGAAPINHALINGESETGVTTFLIDEKIDTGNILLQKKTAIAENETAGELHDRLMEMGAKLVVETVHGLTDGHLKARTQENSGILKKAPKIFKDDCRISWDREGLEVNNLIRGLSPYPAAYTYLEKSDGKKILCKVFSSSFEPAAQAEEAGSIVSDRKKYLKVAVKDGYIQIYSIQQEGKRRMNVVDFLAGLNSASAPGRFS